MRRRWMRNRLQTIAGSLLIVTAVSACESWGPAESVTSPSNDPALTASIYVPIVSTNGATPPEVPFIPFRCASGLRFTGPVDIAMTAGNDVNLNKVTIRLVTTPGQSSSGTSTMTEHAGNTFTEDDLKSAFGSTQIPGGIVRTFRFRTDLACGQATAEAVAADIQFREKSGRRNTITVTAPFESAIDLG
jgi:hypothetical protein